MIDSLGNGVTILLNRIGQKRIAGFKLTFEEASERRDQE